MSPEQVRGHGVDRRSDLFAMGSILHEIVTLEPVFRGEELVAILRAVLEADVGEAPERLARVHPDLRPIFLRCCARDPSERYPDARALQRDLRALHRKLLRGPTVREWIEELRAGLPATVTGDFGGIAPPLPPGAHGTEPETISLESVEALTTSDPVPATARAQSRPAAARPEPVRPRPQPAARPARRPSRASESRPTQKSAPWQRRAARTAWIQQVVQLTLLSAVGVYAASFLPGGVGSWARGVIAGVVATVRHLAGG
jgi:serine/threonine-protein kinase